MALGAFTMRDGPLGSYRLPGTKPLGTHTLGGGSLGEFRFRDGASLGSVTVMLRGAIGVVVELGAGTATGVGSAVSLSYDFNIALGAGAAAGLGVAPSVTAGVAVALAAGAGTGTGAVPTVSIGDTIVLTAGSGTGAGEVPTVAAGVAVAPGAGAGTGAGEVPTVSVNLNVAPGAGAGTGVGEVPTVAVGVSVALAAGSGTGAGAVPAVAANVSAAPGAGAGTGAGAVPSVSVGVAVSLAAGSATGVGAVPTVSAGASLILDTVTVAGAWSVARRLSTSYTGSLIRIRRSSDNTEQDIGYDGSDDLDTAAISTFVGANSAYVVTIYDQVGSFNFTQATASRQPRIVNAGTLDTLGGKPTMVFDNSDDLLHNTSAFGLYAAGAATVIHTGGGAVGTNKPVYHESGALTTSIYKFSQVGNESSGDMSAHIINSAGTTVFADTVDLKTAAWDGTLHVFTYQDDGGEMFAWEDGTAGTSSTYTRSGSVSTTQTTMGAWYDGTTALSYYNGAYSETIIAKSALGSTDRAAIEDDAGTYYGAP